MEIRDKQHQRVVTLVALIIVISAISLWRELSHVATLGFAPTLEAGLLHSFVSAAILVTLGVVSIIFHRSGRDTKRVASLAYVDELTGLPNKRQFDVRLQQELDRCKRHSGLLATMYFDLDQFKAINDCYGHAAGDLAIATFGERILKEVRNEDVVARLSGDEFAAIITGLRAPGDISILADRIIEAMRQPIIVNDKSIYVGVSIGASIIKDGAIDAPEALRQADFALLQAKANGRNQLQVFDPEMARNIKSKKLMEADLRQAIAKNGLHLEYQPQVSQDGKTILGVEALVRWTHPRHGNVSPSVFIPIAEEIGLIDKLGEMVLHQACIDVTGLKNTKLAVNISPVQFRQDNFIEIVKKVLEETGFQPSSLELEITEGSFISDPAKAAKTVEKLRELGVCIALDDFGTGYSSLTYLRALPLDRIKIDRSFVKELEHSKDARQLVATMIELGSGLGLNVTVEGIENYEQMDILSKSGCDELQGYLFSKPVSAEILRKLVSAPGMSIGARDEKNQDFSMTG